MWREEKLQLLFKEAKMKKKKKNLARSMNDVRVYVGVTMRSADDKGRASPFFSAQLTPASLAQMAKSELKPSKAQLRHFLEPSGMK